jgi:hypothetical protein
VAVSYDCNHFFDRAEVVFVCVLLLFLYYNMKIQTSGYVGTSIEPFVVTRARDEVFGNTADMFTRITVKL